MFQRQSKQMLMSFLEAKELEKCHRVIRQYLLINIDFNFTQLGPTKTEGHFYKLTITPMNKLTNAELKFLIKKAFDSPLNT